MNRFKRWAAGISLGVAGLFGYHASIPVTHTVETQVVGPPSPYVEATPTPSANQRINISCDDTCTDQEKKDLVQVVQKINEIESGDCFKGFLLDPKNGLDLNQTNGKTAAQTVESVTTARVSTQITYYSQKRNWWTKVIVDGFENGDGRIHANRIAHDDMSLCEKASNDAHEIAHGAPMSFSHDFQSTARRPYSLPYSINRAFEACCK
jgi:hypothetical protein